MTMEPGRRRHSCVPAANRTYRRSSTRFANKLKITRGLGPLRDLTSSCLSFASFARSENPSLRNLFSKILFQSFCKLSNWHHHIRFFVTHSRAEECIAWIGYSCSRMNYKIKMIMILTILILFPDLTLTSIASRQRCNKTKFSLLQTA